MSVTDKIRQVLKVKILLYDTPGFLFSYQYQRTGSNASQNLGFAVEILCYKLKF